MTYLQLYRQVQRAKEICDYDDVGCGSCPYSFDERCRSKFWEDVSRLESALEDLGEIPEN